MTDQIVLEVGAEDGSLKLYRRRMLDGTFAFFTSLNAMGFEDIAGLQETSGFAASFQNAVALLDAAPGCDWTRLHPMSVHADYATSVLQLVETRLSGEREHLLDRWRQLCLAELVREVAEHLRRSPERLDDVRAKIPSSDGLYAWWVRRGAIASVPSRPHPTEPGFDLLYVGIAPARASSASTIRSRVLENHLGGNIAASTFRFTLAALLKDELHLVPLKKGKKTVLSSEQNSQLSTWQRANLRMTWHAAAKPWLFEAAVIAELKPPLNIDDNHDDAFRSTVKQARAALRRLASEQP